jgi:hypothetical protein
VKLYKIKIRHCAPKDCKESIVGYFLAENDLAIYNYIDKELLGGIWNDRHEEDGLFEYYDDNDNLLGKEHYRERMLRYRGEFNDPHADYSDAYYGITHYGWDEGKEIWRGEVETLLEFGIATLIE